MNLKIFYPDNRVQQNKSNQGQIINSKGHTPEGNVCQNVLQRSLKKIQIVVCEPTLIYVQKMLRGERKNKSSTHTNPPPQNNKMQQVAVQNLSH